MSVPLQELYEDTTSEFAAEGTMAHELAEYYLLDYLGLPIPSEKPTSDNPDFDLLEMERHAEDYASYVCEQRTGSSDLVGVEKRVILNGVVDGVQLGGLCFGTADCILLSDEGRTLHIIDYKYGRGVEVDAKANSQLMIYAICALSSAISMELAHKVQFVKLHIYQPRIGNVSSWETSKTELLNWYQEVVTPAISGVLNKQYTTVAGDHCRWCRHLDKCKVYAATFVDPIENEMRLEATTLTKERIGEILAVKDDVIKWLNALSDRVLTDMLNGDDLPGYKVVEGRSVRKITDSEGAIAYLRSKGYKEVDIFKPLELQNLTTIQKLVGKKVFDTEMSQFVTKPQGKPTLASLDDKRPVYVSEQDQLNDKDLFK